MYIVRIPLAVMVKWVWLKITRSEGQTAGFGPWNPLWVDFGTGFLSHSQMAVGQNQWYHFGLGAPRIESDVHWG